MQDIRNIAIIAHVDHGKTTLVDKILSSTNISDIASTSMDNNDLERERGITIFSKNAATQYNGVKINIIDTPGHADFGGEVERVLKMADGVALLVDSFEGPMPQTRFVLHKALELGLKPLVIINKVDKPNCRPEEVHDAVFDLFFNLDATEEQLNFPTFYGSSKEGWFNTENTRTEDITPLLDGIIKYVPAPEVKEGPLQMQITSLDYTSFLGRIAVGKITRGSLKEGQWIALVKEDGSYAKHKVKELYTFEGQQRKRTTEVHSGDICAIVGIEGFQIGNTISDPEKPEGLPNIHIDEPTMNMSFGINNSPFFGKDGKFVTSRHLMERLEAELERNLALRVETTEDSNTFMVYGRGIMHLSVLIETMRREGYELTVGQPQVIFKEIDGVRCEPYEILVIDVPENLSSRAIDLVTQRKGDLLIMESKGDTQHLEFEIPSRGLIGLRSNVLTATAGEAVMAHRFSEYKPFKGEISGRSAGVLISKDQGVATPYSIDKLQDRGEFFISPGEDVYTGMIIGEHSRGNDLVVNVVEAKKLTNMRASGKDDSSAIAPKIEMSLEEYMEYIQRDECIEVTPNHIRLRKIVLREEDRKRLPKN